MQFSAMHFNLLEKTPALSTFFLLRVKLFLRKEQAFLGVQASDFPFALRAKHLSVPL